jgi:hypothetical protein
MTIAGGLWRVAKLRLMIWLLRLLIRWEDWRRR